MIDNWPYAIIGELLKRYGESPTDLSRFLIETVGIPKDDIVRAKKIKTILDYFKDEGYLTWKTARWVTLTDGTANWDWANGEIYRSLLGNDTHGDRGTLENTRVEAHLTIKGLEFATNIIRNKEIHKSTVNTNFLMRLFTGVLTIFTVISVCFQIRQSNKTSTIENKKADSLLLEQVTTLKKIQEDHNNTNSLLKELVDSLKSDSKTKVITKTAKPNADNK